MDNYIIDNEYQLKLNTETSFWDTYYKGILLPRSTDKLYKYFSLNLYSIDSLLRTYFHLANPGDFNDPFDCNVNLTEEIDLKNMRTVKRNSYSNIGVCSFSENINSHLMWAHYTDNYNGFALQFDGEGINVNLSKQMQNHTLTRVIYPILPPKIKKTFPFALHYLLTTKFKYWDYEKEWRIIARLDSADREMEYFPESVKGIYIGHKIFDDNKSAYKLLLEI